MSVEAALTDDSVPISRRPGFPCPRSGVAARAPRRGDARRRRRHGRELYLSLGLVPCDLCWYQRILMYPLVIVLGVAAAERRPGVWRTALPLSLSGAAVAAYHVGLQLRPAPTCSISGGGCGAIQYTLLGGLLTVPRLSLLAFLLVTVGTAGAAVGRAD